MGPWRSFRMRQYLTKGNHGSMGSACGVERRHVSFSTFSQSSRCPGQFRADFLRDFKPFQAVPHAEGLDDSDFIENWTSEGTACGISRLPHATSRSAA